MVKITTIRPMFFHGRRVEAFQIIEANASDAAMAVAAGRAKYLTVMEEQKAKMGVQEEDAKIANNDRTVRSSFWSRREQEKRAP